MAKNLYLFVFFYICINFALFAQPHWAQKSGGTGFDMGLAVASDDSANLYVTGVYFDKGTFGQIEIPSTFANTYDIFAVKYDKNGIAQWASHAGGSAGEGHGICVSPVSKNVTIAGYYSDTLYVGTDTLYSRGAKDIFIASYDNDGNFLWSATAGGALDDEGSAITSDNAGNIYVTGFFTGDVTFLTTTYTGAGDQDIFTVCYNSAGVFQWVRTAGGPGTDKGKGICEKNGNVFIVGEFRDSALFDTTQLISYGGSDAFIASYSSSGNNLWMKNFGSRNGETANAITADHSSDLYITGYWYSGFSFKFGNDSITGNGEDDIYIVKCDASGNGLNLINTGGTSNDESNAISVDQNKSVYITGRYLDSTLIGSQSFTGNGAYDVFVAKFDSTFNTVDAYSYGGINYDEGHGITSNQTGTAVSTGFFMFNTDFGNTSLSSVNADIFLVTTENTLQNDEGFLVTNYHTGNSSVASNNISDIILDHHSQPWIATPDSGIAFFDGNVWQKFNTSNSGIASNNITGLYIDSLNTKWMATADRGIVSYNDTVFTIYNTGNSNLPTNNINSITGFPGNESLWIGTDDVGCVRLNLATSLITIFDTASLVPSNNVNTMASDSAGTFWMGTKDVGVANFVNGTITQYNTGNSGIADDHINGIYSDNSGNVWFATERGISRFDGTNWTTFDTSNGEITNDFNDVVITPSGNPAKASKKKGAVVNSGVVQRHANNNNMLFDNDVVSIAVDPTETKYWLATRSNGVFLLIDTALISGLQHIYKNDLSFSIYPNPVKDILTLSLNLEKPAIYNLLLSDISGKIIMNEKINFSSAGISKKELQLNNIGQGVYTAILQSENIISAVRVVKIN